MANLNWRILVHASGGPYLTYTLSSFQYDGATKRYHGIDVMSSCRPGELPAVLDQLADLIRSDLDADPPTAQQTLPLR